jgi:hypothetical protein
MQIDPWRQQLQQVYANGVFGGHSGHQAFAGPSTMQAYAMSGQGRYLDPAQGQGTSQGAGQGMTGGNLLSGTSGGGVIADMIRQYIEQQRAQQSGGANLQLPKTQLPRTPGLLGSY